MRHDGKPIGAHGLHFAPEVERAHADAREAEEQARRHAELMAEIERARVACSVFPVPDEPPVDWELAAGGRTCGTIEWET